MNGIGQLYVMVGPPFSGKTYWINNGGFDKAFPDKRPPAIIEPNQVRRALTGRFAMFPQTASEEIMWANIVLMVRALLLNGNNVILDTCNTRRYQRAKWSDMEPCFVVMETPLRVSLSRVVESDRASAETELIVRRSYDSFDAVHIGEGMVYSVKS